MKHYAVTVDGSDAGAFGDVVEISDAEQAARWVAQGVVVELTDEQYAEVDAARAWADVAYARERHVQEQLDELHAAGFRTAADAAVFDV